MSEELKKNIRIRSSIKQKLTSLEKYIDSIKIAEQGNEPHVTEIEVKLQNYEPIFQEFQDIQLKIEISCDKSQVNDQYKERETFENRYCKCFTFLKNFIKNCSIQQNLTSASNHSINNSQQNNSLNNVLVPKIKIPTFKGDFEHWLEFKCTFMSVVHSNNNLTDIHKFQLLRASVDGYAKRIIEKIEFTDNYYETAWAELCNRFDKKGVLVNKHIKSLFNLEQIHKESAKQLRELLDNVSENISSIEGLKISKELLCDILLVHIISNKLDKYSFREWKEFNYKGELPTLDDFFSFLKNKVDILEQLHDQGSSSQGSYNSFSKQSIQRSSQVHLSYLNKSKCNLCKGSHLIYSCSEFLKLDVPSRIVRVDKLKLCKNCLRTGHSIAECSLGSCKKCQSKHNTLLHLEMNSNAVNNDSVENTNTSSSSQFNSQVRSYDTQVLLSTVICNIQDVNGQLIPCRALLDSGAQTNLITENFCHKLKIPLLPTELSIIGINQASSKLTRKCNITIRSRCNNFQTSLLFYVIPTISKDIPSQDIRASEWNIPDNLNLADPCFHLSKEIDAIIGASLFWDLLLEGKISLGKGKPILQNTLLGWVISGTLPFQSCNAVCNFTKAIIPEDHQLRRFWEVEEINSESMMSSDDFECEKLFSRTTTRNSQGQFVVKFPLKFAAEQLGNSVDTATKRFLSLERKFSINNELYIQYKQFIHEYISLGHMSKITNTSEKSRFPYYLPHHGILKEHSLTTKLRVVFDGSCPSDNGWSLNDLQFTGPKIQNDIFPILVRFRIYTYVVSADIMKMYRQILMHPEHRPLQCIIWRDNPAQAFDTYQLNTVTYGTTSAPYLAIKCLRQLALDPNISLDISNIILNSFYVDDLLIGSDDVETLSRNMKQLYDHLASANFFLRKWISNDKRVLSNLKFNHDDSLGILPLGTNECSKTLGIQWYSQPDILKYKITPSQLPENISKRQILSDIAQIYDPLGLVSPTIIIAKILIQKLWTLRISWDEPVPMNLSNQWNQFRSELVQLNSINITRNAVGQGYQILDIHCFCDASQNAYACCIYIRSVNERGDMNVKLLCSKTKVSPIKVLSIPRLELCAALIGAQLTQQVQTAFDAELPYFFWSDSQVVLYWINSQPNLLETFVANRVTKIHSLTDVKHWNYVVTNQNPADVASRGILATKLLKCDIWWFGPKFLYETSPSDWNNLFSFQCTKTFQRAIPELKKQSIKLFPNIQLPQNDLNICEKYSNLHKLKRVSAYCIRFIKNLKAKPEERLTGLLSVNEIETSFLKLIKFSQLQSFQEEISLLSKDKPLVKKSKLFYLAPFLDGDEVLRVGGRLKYSSLPVNTKHPIILSTNHPLTQLIFNHYHSQLLHPGPQLLLSLLRQRYWPVNGKIFAKKVVRNCITCFKCKPTRANAPIGPLPDNRFIPAFPFENVGIDYAGPFSIKDKKGRGSKLIKAYVCIFVCFVTKALHIELLTDLTTESFLACFRRFTSRRGLPRNVYSDNGTTFKGAHNELQALGTFLNQTQCKINTHALNLNIIWHFTPPYSPNFGGLWEASVKSMKFHLKRTMKDTNLTYEEFSTLLYQIECILNSRPLFSMSDNPSDLAPLTPSHFLIGRPSTILPETDLRNIAPNRLTRFQHIQQLQQRFWTRFSREYISQLHQSYKWKDQPTPISPGTLVLIQDKNLPPCKWSVGRVHQLYPGKDAVSRVVDIRTSKGIIKRSIRHLHPLPLESKH